MISPIEADDSVRTSFSIITNGFRQHGACHLLWWRMPPMMDDHHHKGEHYVVIRLHMNRYEILDVIIDRGQCHKQVDVPMP